MDVIWWLCLIYFGVYALGALVAGGVYLAVRYLKSQRRSKQ